MVTHSSNDVQSHSGTRDSPSYGTRSKTSATTSSHRVDANDPAQYISHSSDRNLEGTHRALSDARVEILIYGGYAPARPARRVPPSASLATDHSGRAGALRTARARSGLKWMCPRRQRFTRSGPRDLGKADRDGRGCVAANGECAGRSLRAGRRAVLVGTLL